MSYTPSRNRIETTSEENNSDGWLITFVDLISLVLCFFVLIFSTAELKKPQWKVVNHSLSKRLNPDETPSLFSQNDELSITRVDPKKADSLEYLYTILGDRIGSIPELAMVTKFNLLEDRLIISLVGDTYFSPGQADLPEKTKRIIAILGPALSIMENSIEINSYSDPRPINTAQFPSNWELSLSRAISASNALRKSGYPYTITAFGRSSSLFGEISSDISLEERQELSRRIDIVVRKVRAF